MTYRVKYVHEAGTKHQFARNNSLYLDFIDCNIHINHIRELLQDLQPEALPITCNDKLLTPPLPPLLLSLGLELYRGRNCLHSYYMRVINELNFPSSTFTVAKRVEIN